MTKIEILREVKVAVKTMERGLVCILLSDRNFTVQKFKTRGN